MVLILVDNKGIPLRECDLIKTHKIKAIENISLNQAECGTSSSDEANGPDEFCYARWLEIKTHYSWEATSKSNHAKGWWGPGWVQSLGDFYSLDAPGLWFLKPMAGPPSQRALQQKKIYLLQNLKLNQHMLPNNLI